MAATGRAAPPSRRHPLLYEINTYAWLEELSAQEGREIALGSVPAAEWDRLKQFDFVWLMGVWRRSPIGRRIMRTDPAYFSGYDEALPDWTMCDVVGSPYAVQDYAPDPRFGGWRDLDRARSELNARGVRLILDFVCNHTALDHEWISRHPEYYIQGTLEDFRREPTAWYLREDGGEPLFIACGKDPYCPAWPDSAQLNYFRPEVRDAMLGVLCTIAAHTDGVRCDMAMLVLNDIFSKTWQKHLNGAAPGNEFWPSAITALPGFTWIAEVYWDLEWRLQQLGFNFTYDKRLYDRLRSEHPQSVRSHLTADRAYQNGLVRFLENHDEPRSAAVFGSDKLPALATLISTLPGMRFFHQGQFEGRKMHLPIPLRRVAAPPHDPPDAVVEKLYASLLGIIQEDAFHAGQWQLLVVSPAGDGSYENLIAWQWQLGEVVKVVAVNLGANVSAGNIALEWRVDSSSRYSFYDQLNHRAYEWRGADLARSGLYVRLDAFRSHIFDLRKVES